MLAIAQSVQLTWDNCIEAAATQSGSSKSWSDPVADIAPGFQELKALLPCSAVCHLSKYVAAASLCWAAAMDQQVGPSRTTHHARTIPWKVYMPRYSAESKCHIRICLLSWAICSERQLTARQTSAGSPVEWPFGDRRSENTFSTIQESRHAMLWF